MQAANNSKSPALNGQTSQPDQPNIAQIWSTKTSEAIACLIDFRSFCHRMMAAGGRIDEAEFAIEVQKLESAGLGAWADDLLALALADAFRKSQEKRQMPGRLARRRWLASAAGLIVIGHELVGKELVKMLRGGER